MWPANSRYKIEPAPGGLGFVHDFLNTKPHARPTDEDLLGNVESAQRWLDAALGSWSAVTKKRIAAPKLSSGDVRELRNLRVSLQDPRARPGSASHAAAPVLELPVGAQLHADGSALLLPVGTGWKLVGSLLLLEAVQAQALDTWRRLKICRNEPCACIFYDHSKNNSGVWHRVACGNVVNLRASRARHRDE